MDASSPRWHRVTPSTFAWEDEAIEFLRGVVPDADPILAWSNFELISGGVISEIDVFLLTRKGAFLIEIKSTPGRVSGDQQRWVFHKPDGGRTSMENPLLITNRKAKRIKSLLDARWRDVAGPNASPRPPFVQPVVFLSDPDLKVDLAHDARVHVYGRDGSTVVKSGALQGIRDGVVTFGALESQSTRFEQLNTPTTKAVGDILRKVGIKESDHTRRVGDLILQLGTVVEREGVQDFLADHASTKGVQRRVRIYSTPLQASTDQWEMLRRAADREFLVAERVQHPHVVRAIDRTETDFGPAVIFDHDAAAVRLDQWLDTVDDITIDDRLLVLRQIAETLQAVHRRKVTHRALSPKSVLVRPGRSDEPRWVVLLTDFSLAGRDHASASGGARTGTRLPTMFGLPTAGPGDVEALADEAQRIYSAPELFTDSEPDGVSLDVFSFGALAFYLVAGRPPGESRDAVRQVLQSGRGLQLSAEVPGVVESLHDLVVEATRPLVSERLSSFDDVMAGLDLVEEELTAPVTVTTEPEAVDAAEVDPLDAKKGDVLGDGSVVKAQLGRGSTARALLVEREEAGSTRQLVYKVALGGDADARLADEARILIPLRHPGVVEAFELIELGGRQVLVEAKAGDESLADELRRNGTPGIEFLQRWGSDLLDALRHLERVGRAHRDIKPDNLGVTEVGPNREQHLVLFDFSLATASSTDLRAGTPPYLEPFLADRPKKQWDLAAERYAAAVTLYEMATGELPRWGDGQSDPSFTDDEVTLDVVLFDSGARDPLEAFFRRALRRDPAERFGNAEEMLSAWNRVFEGLDATPHTASRDDVDDSATIVLPDGLGLDDPVVSLRASAKVVSALGRLDISTVRQLALLAPVEVNRAKRISPRVRRRIVELRAAVLARFGDELADTAGATTRVSSTPEQAESEVPRLDLDALVPLLVPRARRKGTVEPAVRMLLGLDPLPDGSRADWPSQSAVSAAFGLSRQRLSQLAGRARTQWAELAPLVSVRDDIVDLVVMSGGVVAVRELEPLLVDLRGSGLPAAEASIAARAVLRAAIEAEEAGAVPGTDTGARLIVRRRGDRVVVATSMPEGADAAAVAAYAVTLGEHVDAVLADADDVVPQDRAVSLLRAVTVPEGVSLGDGRLIRLAAASSQTGGASSSLELYPVGLDPVRVLRLARQSLAAAEELSEDEVRSRVRARFPLVVLPERPHLDDALRAAEVAVAWDQSRAAYRRDETGVGDLTTLTSVVSRAATEVVRPVRPSRPAIPAVDPDLAVAQAVEGRLQDSLAHGGFLALRVPTTQGPALRRELARFTAAGTGMVSIDLEAWFLDELRAAAATRNVAWAKLVEADLAPAGTTDHTNLRILTDEAFARVEQRVLGAGTRVLAWNAGVLRRYGQMDVIDRLRNRAGLADSDLQTLWLVVFGSTADALPMIDGEPVPVLGASEWVDVPNAWLHLADHLPRTGTAGPDLS